MRRRTSIPFTDLASFKTAVESTKIARDEHGLTEAAIVFAQKLDFEDADTENSSYYAAIDHDYFSSIAGVPTLTGEDDPGTLHNLCATFGSTRLTNAGFNSNDQNAHFFTCPMVLDNIPMWCNQAVSTLNALGVFKGKTETYFNTSASITRAEFAAVCARFDTGVTEEGSNFTDIAGHWAEAEIERAASLGWMRSYADGTFRPDQPIIRVSCHLPEDDLLDGMNIWLDNRPGDWYHLAVQETTNIHVYKPKGEIYETWTQKLEDLGWTQYQ